uniref:Uncharacterized protein n=1 Tax=Ditylenchus dipsaci TaxID=166011 RepID=A0A915DV20_9BILA
MVFQEIGFLIDVGVFPFTVEMIGFDYNEDGVYIFMTLITGGNLKEYCENQSNLENKNKQGMENLNR